MCRCRSWKERAAKIPESGPAVTPGVCPRRKGITMCYCDPIPVRLLDGGRYFRCPYCNRLRRHPFCDPFYIMEGRAYCDFCGLWMKIDPTPPPTPTRTGDAAGTRRGAT